MEGTFGCMTMATGLSFILRNLGKQFVQILNSFSGRDELIDRLALLPNDIARKIVDIKLDQTPPIGVIQFPSHSSAEFDKEQHRLFYHLVVHFLNFGNNKFEQTNTTFHTDHRCNKDIPFQPPVKYHRHCCEDIDLPPPTLIGSYNGFLVFRCCHHHVSTLFVFNPIAQERFVGRSFFVGKICGLYFHTQSRQYRIMGLSSDNRKYVFNFYVGLRRRLVHVKSMCYDGDEVPFTRRPPVVLHGALHWMASVGRDLYRRSTTCSTSILIFKTETEEFSTMPHPGDQCESESMHNMMRLFDMEGNLCLCKTWKLVLNVWVIKDYKKQVWNKIHTVDIPSGGSPYSCPQMEVVHINGDQVLFISGMSKLFHYSLSQRTLCRVAIAEPYNRMTAFTHKSRFTFFCSKSDTHSHRDKMYGNLRKGCPRCNATKAWPRLAFSRK